jgi:outer membrane protein OmpA-like peptidoglycan-associated protein
MFKKKSSGETVAAYSLSKIAFDPNSHKITSMSKNEVEGLAAALKAYPDAKITVQATGGDKKLSKMKAQVIHDMLVTLGVSDKQISAKGMGDGAEKFEIVLD